MKPLSLRSSIAAVAAGFAGFAANTIPYETQVGEYTLSLTVGLVFPMVVALAWGWRYALLAAVVGLGGQSCWLLWPENGWANVVPAVLHTGWFLWHGRLAQSRQQRLVWHNNLYVGEALFRAISISIMYLVYPLCFRFNPPSWYPEAFTEATPLSVLHAINAKSAINGLFVLLAANVLLTLGPIRRLAGLPRQAGEEYSSRAVSAALLFGLASWVLSGLLSFCFLNRDGRSFFEILVIHPDPHDLVLRLLMIVVCLAAGLIVGEYLRRTAEARDALRCSEERFRALVETTSDWIWELDREARFTYASPRVRSLLGYDPEALIGTSGYDLMPPQEADRISAAFSTYVEAQKPFRHLENVNLHRDGHRVILESNGEPFFDDEGTLLGYRGSDRDITGRIQVEDEARRFKAIAEAATYGVAVAHLDQTLMYVNEAFASMHGYERDELTGQPISILHSEEQLEQVQRLIGQLSDNSIMDGVEVWHARKDGTVFPTIMSGVVINGPDGNPAYFSATVIDITRHKELEVQMVQAQKMDSIGQLAGGIAHDFNNMLGGIMGYAELLNLRMKEDPKLSAYTQGILTAAEHAADLTDKLLSFSRKGKMFTVTFDMHDTIEDALAILRHSIDRRIEIQVDLGASPSTVKGDPSQIQNALINVAVNARDAMPKGGVLSMRTSNVMLEEDAFPAADFILQPGAYVLVEIADTGVGIGQEEIAHVFEPFFTTKGVGEGTGLGLAAVYGTMRDHGGVVDIQSKVGKGTNVFFYLPVDTSPPCAKKTNEAVHIPEDSEGCILIVDDEPVIRSMAREALQIVGYDTQLAANGKEALELYRKNSAQIDLVVLDMIMPEMNGEACLAELQAMDPEVKVLITSGYTREIAVRQLEKSETVHFLKKPFHAKDLIEAVAKAL